MMNREMASMERADAARRVLIETLMAEGIFPGPLPPTLWRSVEIRSEKQDYRDHFIEVVLPVAVDISHIPTDVDGVRIVVIHEDRHGTAYALMDRSAGAEDPNQ
jgi:hypothetical protein